MSIQPLWFRELMDLPIFERNRQPGCYNLRRGIFTKGFNTRSGFIPGSYGNRREPPGVQSADYEFRPENYPDSQFDDFFPVFQNQFEYYSAYFYFSKVEAFLCSTEAFIWEIEIYDKTIEEDGFVNLENKRVQSVQVTGLNIPSQGNRVLRYKEDSTSVSPSYWLPNESIFPRKKEKTYIKKDDQEKTLRTLDKAGEKVIQIQDSEWGIKDISLAEANNSDQLMSQAKPYSGLSILGNLLDTSIYVH